MPGWHEATTHLRESERLATAGVVLEQHRERAQLFMQWKQMDWPVVWDPFNHLELSVVPVTVLADPEGVILLIQPLVERLDEIEESHIGRPGEAVSEHEKIGRRAPKATTGEAGTTDWGSQAVQLATWGDPQELDDAVGVAETAVGDGEDPGAWFRLGVIRRMRHDSPLRRADDFAAAVVAWTHALELDPNNYIWRRRLQQYGPRLAKPYPFYDWVPLAREEIAARGEEPVRLLAEPRGAEFAEPLSVSIAPFSADETTEPDPAGSVVTDEGLISVSSVLIPPAARPGEAVRAHLILEPNAAVDAHWNNEAGLSQTWISGPDGWAIDPPLQTMEPGTEDISSEARHIEFEIGIPEDVGEGTHTISGYALYYACEGRNGVCVYRRQDISIDVNVSSGVTSLV